MKKISDKDLAQVSGGAVKYLCKSAIKDLQYDTSNNLLLLFAMHACLDLNAEDFRDSYTAAVHIGS